MQEHLDGKEQEACVSTQNTRTAAAAAAAEYLLPRQGSVCSTDDGRGPAALAACSGGSRQSLAGKQSRVGGDPGEKEGIRSRVVDRIDQLSLYQATPKTLLQLFQREAAASDDLFLGSFMAMSRRWRRKSTADHVAKGDRKRVSVRGAVNQKRAIDRLGNLFLGLRRGALFMPLD